MSEEEEPGAGLPVFPVQKTEPETPPAAPSHESGLYQPPFVGPGYSPPAGRPAPGSSPASVPAPAPPPSQPPSAYQPPAPAPPPAPARPAAAPQPPAPPVQPVPGAPVAGAPIAGAPLSAPMAAPPPTAPPPAAGPVSRFSSNPARLKLALAGGGVLLLLVAYLVSGAIFSGMESSNQDKALRQTGSDLTKIDAFLSNTDIRDTNKTDHIAFKAAIDAYGVKLTDAAGTLAGDQDRLDQINRDIEFYGLFTPLQSTKVHSNDGTIRHAKNALDDFAKAVGMLKTQEAFYSTIVSAEVDSAAADKAARAKDITTAAVNDEKAVADLNQCKLLDKDPDVPPQFVPLVELLSKVMRDITGIDETANAQDLPGFLQYLQDLVRDDQAITFDQAAYLAWYSEKFNPLLKDFRANAVAVPGYVVTTTKLV